MKDGNKQFIKATGLITLLVFFMLAVTGCGGFNVFKELDVNDKNIPDYHLTGKAVLGEPDEDEFSGLWATLTPEEDEITEEDARKIAANYITESKGFDLISIRIKHYEETYLAEYYKDKAAVENAGLDKEFDKWPAVTFEKVVEDD